MSKTTIEVLVNGRAVKTYSHQGKTYIEAKAGTQYELRVRNHTQDRILAIVSVDGLNVITGERATPEDSGYIVDAWNASTIKGFRHSDDNVAAFKFVTKADSYNAQTGGDTSNVGVIGLIAYEDYDAAYRRSVEAALANVTYMAKIPKGGTPWRSNDQHFGNGGYLGGQVKCSYSAGEVHDGSACADYSASFGTSSRRFLDPGVPTAQRRLSVNTVFTGAAPQVKHSVGTGWGDNIEQRVKTVEFKRGSEIARELVFYSSRKDLTASGIIPPPNEIKIPSAFASKYAKAPLGWRAA